jgi:hypothetical protein
MTYSQQQARLNVISAVKLIEGATKTVGYFRRVLNKAVLDFYRDDITAFEFIDIMTRLIEDQYRRAWNQGARDVGFNPKDMTDDDILTIMERIDREKEYILDFAGGIENARLTGGSVGPYQSRVDMWANRYNEIRDWARIYFADMKRFVWVLGPTEHCDSCKALAGTVATGLQWRFARAEGIYPKSRRLQCGGFRCQCSLNPTKRKPSGGIPPI